MSKSLSNNHQPLSKCFKIFYTKQLKKKKKVYEEGILVINIFEDKSSTGKIYSSDGLQIFSFRNRKYEEPQIDEQYVLNHTYLILIDCVANIEDFKTGKIFLQEAISIPKNKKKVVQNKKHDQKQDNQIELACGLGIDKLLWEKLREHQIQGVNFMYECLSGKRGPNITGCILADYMGLGKTLQMLTLAVSMLKNKTIKKFIVVCPLTLLTVWERQTNKWLPNKLTPLICYGDGNETAKIVGNYAQSDYRMLVISYQTFYKNLEKLSGKCDLIAFDEGHRLKNKKSKLLLKMKAFRCKMRVLLTGTPIQNNLDQLFTCISLINPILYPSEATFRNVFEKPILQGMSKKATFAQKTLAKQRTIQLSNQLKQFSLRRNTDILQKYLPIKTEYMVFFHLTPLQKLWYKRIISCNKGNKGQSEQNKKSDDIFKTLSYLRKLFTHPKIFKKNASNRGQFWGYQEDHENQKSFKMEFTIQLIKQKLKVSSSNKIVVVSYYTEILDYLAQKLKEECIRYEKLNGKMKCSDRKKSLLIFENNIEVPILLLSGKAGGTGLTLVCATTMILIEPDWNPSNDCQVMARIWRQGQERQVQVYRLIIACSFEERILQRQNIKKSLAASLIDNDQKNTYEVDYENLGQLFIDNRDELLSFRQDENDENIFYQKHPQFSKKNNDLDSGIIFVKQKCSHQQNGAFNDIKKTFHNQFENINILSKSEDEESIIQTESDDDPDDTQIKFIGELQNQKIKLKFDQNYTLAQKNKKIQGQKTEDQAEKEQNIKIVKKQQNEEVIEDESLVLSSDIIKCQKQLVRYKNGKKEVDLIQESSAGNLKNILKKIKKI